MKKYSNKEKETLLNNYFNEHGSSYTACQKKKIIKQFCKDFSDSLTQLYYALHMLDESENPYIAFRNIIERTFGLDINILEIGGGIYPALSDSISLRQAQIGKGRITVYDPLLSKNINISGVTLIKKEFQLNDDVSKYDLIIGKEPCISTHIIIEKSINKNLLLSPCKCYDLLPSYIDYSDNPLEQWYYYIQSILEDSENQIVTHFLDKKTHYDNPIYTKTIKK